MRGTVHIVAVALFLAASGCSDTTDRPVILSFTVDEPQPEAGTPVRFSYSVSGAAPDGVRIDPVPGPVKSSPVTVVPPGSGTFTLSVFNLFGDIVSRDLQITVVPRFAINAVDATPGQVTPGGEVTLSWSMTKAERASVTDPTSGQVFDVATSGSMIVHPVSTTVYTVTAYNKPGRSPASLTAKITARVAVPPSVGDFVATPPSIVQGGTTTLSWSGNAVSYVVSDGTTTFNVGPRRSLLVRPAATTTYTLRALGSLGASTSPAPLTVTVDPRQGTTLRYNDPAAAPLQLVADACANAPCTTVTLRIKATTTVALRGLALDLPLDATKATFGGFVAGPALPGAVSKAAMGSGLLQDVLVIGVALKGTGMAPAQDVILDPGAEIGSFTLTLLPGGGVGTVFNGAAPLPRYKAMIQSAAGRGAGTLAVGTLEAN